MTEFIAGFVTCYLLLTGLALYRAEVWSQGNVPFLVKLQFTILTMVVIMPVLIWHGAKNIVFGLEEIKRED